MTAIAISDLTQATLEGTGIFDVLMRANKAHLEAEFVKGRIKGPEYADVYLGSLNQVLQMAMQFLLSKEKADLEAQLLQKQILLAQAQIDKTASEKAQVEAQTLLINQQKANLLAEASNIPKQGLLIDAQKDVQLANKAQVEAQTLLVGQQKANLVAEASNIPKQGLLIDAQKDAQVAAKAHTEADTLLINQKKTNAVTENTVLVAQECKLRAEYDLTMETKLKTTQETALLSQKVVTERAQVTALGVDTDSVVGRQKALYVAQATGFTRDAEQKAAKLMVDTWNVRRTTDEGTSANSTNKLDDAAVGRAVIKLLDGVGA